jgi:hypothetical protein
MKLDEIEIEITDEALRFIRQKIEQNSSTKDVGIIIAFNEIKN